MARDGYLEHEELHISDLKNTQRTDKSHFKIASRVPMKKKMATTNETVKK